VNPPKKSNYKKSSQNLVAEAQVSTPPQLETILCQLHPATTYPSEGPEVKGKVVPALNYLSTTL
jgi:hypothetical protein